MSKIVFSKAKDGYSPSEVDVYINMIEEEHIKAVELISAQTTKLAELENVISKLTIENSQFIEERKTFDFEISKVREEVESLKKQLEEEANKRATHTEVFEDKDSLIEAILSLARTNEKLVVGGVSSKEQEVYHSKSQVDQIVDTVLSEGGKVDTSVVPRFSL